MPNTTSVPTKQIGEHGFRPTVEPGILMRYPGKTHMSSGKVSVGLFQASAQQQAERDPNSSTLQWSD